MIWGDNEEGGSKCNAKCKTAKILALSITMEDLFVKFVMSSKNKKAFICMYTKQARCKEILKLEICRCDQCEFMSSTGKGLMAT